jgi:hypothetical protein
MGYKTKRPKQLSHRRGTTVATPKTLPHRMHEARRAASKSRKATGKNW